VDKALLTVLPQYLRLTSSATVETIRRNPLTAGYATTYFELARACGTGNARAWLLGSIIRDFHGAALSDGAGQLDQQHLEQ
jgi:hypothetical protein